MRYHRHRLTTITTLLILLFGGSGLEQLAAAEQTVTIVRDNYGIPHIFAATEEAACYAMGYAQAEDRLEELLKQYRRATGTMSEAFGPTYFRDDYRQRLWRHAAIAREKYDQQSVKVRGMTAAYQAGVKAFMREHPEQVPDWAPQIEPWMCVALSRYVIWGWPEGDAGEDMQRAGIKPDPIAYHGSNEWLVAPQRTAAGVPIALIDPHLSWYGAFRFYEARLYGGQLAVSGMAILGLPLPSLGHSRYCSVAMTTGGPDAADCYEIEIDPDRPHEYRYDGKWRKMTVRKETIRVKEGNTVHEKLVELRYTHHGPIVAEKDGKVYALKLPYFDQVLLTDQNYRMLMAHNLDEMKAALSMFQLMEQNIMVATVDGDIYYLRNGRVPIRAPGYDYKRLVPGNTSKTEWRGFHRLADLVQLENPPQGYMQNCNVSPQFITRNCPLTPDRWSDHPYLFNGFLGMDRRYDNPLHQRAAMCLELLAAADRMTVKQAIAIALNTQVYGAATWQKMLKQAWPRADRATRDDRQLAAMVDTILAWDRHCDADSVGAIAYYYWKKEFPADVILADRAGFPPPTSVIDTQIVNALVSGTRKLIDEYGRVDVPYGEIYRVGRRGTGRTWPVSGGSLNSIATPRAISFEPIKGKKQFLGHGGQTSTQIVLLTRPPQSWTVLPLGESDHPDSPHYDDQAEKLFSQSRMKPSYFLDRKTLDAHTTAVRKLHVATPADG